MATHNTPKLRFGVMCHGYSFPAWEAECIKNLIASGDAEPVLLIRDTTEPNKKSWLQLLSEKRLVSELFDQWWLRRRSRALRPYDMSDILHHVDMLDCVVIQKGKFSQYFTDDDIATIKSYQLDFILRFGFNIIRGDILQAARYGVWSYHHDDETRYRGGPPCFWEIYHGDATTGAILQRLTNRLDGGSILHRGYFQTCHVSYVNNLDRAYFGSTDWCARVCAEIMQGQTDKFTSEPSTSQAPIYRGATARQFAYFLFKTLVAIIKRVWLFMLYLEVWNVGISENHIEHIIHTGHLENARWIGKYNMNHYLADPFPYISNGNYHVLVEDLDYLGRGKICELILPDSFDQLKLKTSIEPPHHISYPYLFCDNGDLYCIPETHEVNKISLYQQVNGTWEPMRTIVDGVPAVDPTLFTYHGFYWLLFTRQDDGAAGNLKLYGYYADHLHATWQPHPLNPLKCDIRSSRPAGQPVRIGGELYRPSQDCSETYGGAVVINKLLTLSPIAFEEVAVAYLKPIATSPYPHGLHTINAMGKATVIDSKKFTFTLWAWRKNRYFFKLWA